MKVSRFKRQTVYVLALALIFTSVFAGNFSYAETIEDITIKGLDYSSGKLPTENKTYKAGDGSIAYDVSSKTLTLENATVNITEKPDTGEAVLDLSDNNDLKIVLKGKNLITVGVKDIHALKSRGIEIKGDGELDLTLTDKGTTANVINAEALVVSESAHIYVTKEGGYGIDVPSAVHVNSLELKDSAKFTVKDGILSSYQTLELGKDTELNAKIVVYGDEFITAGGKCNFIARKKGIYTVYGNVALNGKLISLNSFSNDDHKIIVPQDATLEFEGADTQDVPNFSIENRGTISFVNDAEFKNSGDLDFTITNNGNINVAKGKKVTFDLKKLPAMQGNGKLVNNGTVEFKIAESTGLNLEEVVAPNTQIVNNGKFLMQVEPLEKADLDKKVKEIATYLKMQGNGTIEVATADNPVEFYYYGNDGTPKNTVDGSFNLNFSENTNDRETASKGLSWKRDDATDSYILTLNGVYLEKTKNITLPTDKKVTIKLDGISQIDGAIASYGADVLQLELTGNGTLITKGLPTGGINGDTITIVDGVKVYVKDKVSFGGSGGEDGILNVKGKGTLLDIDVTSSSNSKGTYLRDINVKDGAELNIHSDVVSAYGGTDNTTDPAKAASINVINGSKLKVACKYGVYVFNGKLTVDESSTLETDATSAGIVVVDATKTKTQDQMLSLPGIPSDSKIKYADNANARFWTIAKNDSTVSVLGNNADPADDITGAAGKLIIKKEEGSGGDPSGGGSSGRKTKPNDDTLKNDDKKTDIKKFDDVNKDDWYYDSVTFAAKNGYMTGISENKFAPMMSTSRAMISQIIYNLENTPKTMSKHNFTDVPQNAWYEQSLNFTFDKDVVEGFPDKTFRGETTITREQLTLILYRYAKYKGYDPDTDVDMSKYEDFKNAGDWSKNSIKWAVKHNIIKGRTNTSLNPTSALTRAELATVLKNFHSEFAE